MQFRSDPLAFCAGEPSPTVVSHPSQGHGGVRVRPCQFQEEGLGSEPRLLAGSESQDQGAEELLSPQPMEDKTSTASETGTVFLLIDITVPVFQVCSVLWLPSCLSNLPHIYTSTRTLRSSFTLTLVLPQPRTLL